MPKINSKLEKGVYFNLFITEVNKLTVFQVRVN
jgi:hypothetical protein